MVRVWKVTNWTEVHDRMKEGERIYSDKFPIANVTGTWQVDHAYLHNAKQACVHTAFVLQCNVDDAVYTQQSYKQHFLWSECSAAVTDSPRMTPKQTGLFWCINPGTLL